MSLRPLPARWFEAIVPRMDSARAAGSLARTGSVELEKSLIRGRPVPLDGLEEGLARYRERVSRYGHYWKRGVLRDSRQWAPPRQILDHALRRIDAW